MADKMESLRAHSLTAAVATILIAYITQAIFRFVSHRKRMSKYPGPPYHPLWGHLLLMGENRKTNPVDMHPHNHPALLAEEFNLGPVFLFDTYPIGPPMLILNDPELAHDVSAVQVYPKDPLLKEALYPFAGPEHLAVMEGPLWKKWRAIFNPGFSMTHLMTLVPLIVDCTQLLVDHLNQDAAKNELFRIEEALTHLTIDVIGRVVLNHDFKSQTTRNEYVDAMRAQLAWQRDQTNLNPIHIYNPIRPFVSFYYTYRMKRYLDKVLDSRLAACAGQPSKSRQRVSIDLALDNYFADEVNTSTTPDKLNIDPLFRQYLIDNFRVLLIAGHDTTSSTIAYALYRLSRHPAVLATLRAEHDALFGPDPLTAADTLKKDPHLLNKLTYTTAVIREILRLYPPATTIRAGGPTLFIKDPASGEMLSTEGLMVWINSPCLHRSRKIWGVDAHDFRPSRFLSPEIDSIDPKAFRPFEKGPRNCIGQELAMLEMKTVLVMVVRLFEFQAAYGEVEKLKGDGTLWAGSAGEKGVVKEVWGDEAYQVLFATAKPREGMPMRVGRRL